MKEKKTIPRVALPPDVRRSTLAVRGRAAALAMG